MLIPEKSTTIRRVVRLRERIATLVASGNRDEAQKLVAEAVRLGLRPGYVTDTLGLKV